MTLYGFKQNVQYAPDESAKLSSALWLLQYVEELFEFIRLCKCNGVAPVCYNKSAVLCKPFCHIKIILSNEAGYVILVIIKPVNKIDKGSFYAANPQGLTYKDNFLLIFQSYSSPVKSFQMQLSTFLRDVESCFRLHHRLHISYHYSEI